MWAPCPTPPLDITPRSQNLGGGGNTVPHPLEISHTTPMPTGRPLRMITVPANGDAHPWDSWFPCYYCHYIWKSWDSYLLHLRRRHRRSTFWREMEKKEMLPVRKHILRGDKLVALPTFPRD